MGGKLIFVVVVLLLVVTTITLIKKNSFHRTKIVFWNEMTGPAKIELKSLVHSYNRSQNKYEVVSQFEGNYTEVVQKILNTHGTNASPAIFQSMDITTSQFYHSRYFTPIQDFIDHDNYDIKQILPVARAFYFQNGKLLSMPFNTSQPILYYNAALLKKYHIVPPPINPTYDEITRVADQLYKRSNKQIKGLSVEINGWLFEQFLANSNTAMTNMADGHLGTPTKVDFTSANAVKSLNWIKENIKLGDFMRFGSGSSASANEIAAFLSGRLGIFLNSSAVMGRLTANRKNELGITYYPHPNGQKANGVAIGGASLWISNDKSTKMQRGAWSFIKFLMKPKNQAKWQVATGYLALNKKSQNAAVLQRLYQKIPAARIPGEQLCRMQPDNTNTGIFLQGLIQERSLIQTAMDQIYSGSNSKKALLEAQHEMNDYVKSVNLANNSK